MELSQRYKQAAKEARWALGFSHSLCDWMVCFVLIYPKTRLGR